MGLALVSVLSSYETGTILPFLVIGSILELHAPLHCIDSDTVTCLIRRSGLPSDPAKGPQPQLISTAH